jgi:hypothetical protein
MSKKKKRILVAGGVYVVLWALTWTWGLHDVDRAFDAEFAVACDRAFGSGHGDDQGATARVVRLSRFNVRDLSDPTNEPCDDYFRYRSRGSAVAPFVIVDEAAWVDAPLSGFGGRRVVFWFFGATTWFPIWAYWVA